MEREISKKRRHSSRRSSQVKYGFVRENHQRWPVGVMPGALGQSQRILWLEEASRSSRRQQRHEELGQRSRTRIGRIASFTAARVFTALC